MSRSRKVVPLVLRSETLRIQTEFGGLGFAVALQRTLVQTKFVVLRIVNLRSRRSSRLHESAPGFVRLEPRICGRAVDPALCSPATRMSIGPASIAPFLAGLGRPPALPGSSFGRARAASCGTGPPVWLAGQPKCAEAGFASGSRGGLRPLSSRADMRCVVTGGAGFIGSNLVDALVERGDEVTAIDSLVNGKRANLEGAIARGATLSVTDVRDAEAIRFVFEQARPEHCLSPRRAGRCPRLGRRSARRRRRQRARDDHRPRSRPGGRGRALRQQLHRWRPVRRRQGDPDARGSPGRHSADGSRTARASSPPRATASCSLACTASRRSRCVTATCTGRGRTSTARPASSRSSVDAWSRAGPRPCTATASQTRDWVEVERRRAGESARAPTPRRSPARSTSATARRPRCSSCSRRSVRVNARGQTARPAIRAGAAG